MTAPKPKLCEPKKIVLIVVSGAIGVGFYLYRRYYETGRIGPIDIFSSVVTIVMLAVIVTVIVRKANRED